MYVCCYSSLPLMWSYLACDSDAQVVYPFFFTIDTLPIRLKRFQSTHRVIQFLSLSKSWLFHSAMGLTFSSLSQGWRLQQLCCKLPINTLETLKIVFIVSIVSQPRSLVNDDLSICILRRISLSCWFSKISPAQELTNKNGCEQHPHLLNLNPATD